MTGKVSCYIISDSEDCLVAHLIKRSLVVRWSLVRTSWDVRFSLTDKPGFQLITNKEKSGSYVIHDEGKPGR